MIIILFSFLSTLAVFLVGGLLGNFIVNKIKAWL